MIGTSCSSAALGVADKILSDKGILLISPSNTNPGLTAEGTHQPFYLRTAHNDKIQAAIVADFVFTEQGLTTAATINDESPYADGLAAGSGRTSRRRAARSRPSRRSRAPTRTSSRCSPASPRATRR